MALNNKSLIKKILQRVFQSVCPIFRGGTRNFCLGGPSVTLIYLSRQLPRTYIYTYARFFIIYTHFLFDKLYI